MDIPIDWCDFSKGDARLLSSQSSAIMSSSPPSKASDQGEQDKCDASPSGVTTPWKPAAAQDQHQGTDIPLDMIGAARRKVGEMRIPTSLQPRGLAGCTTTCVWVCTYTCACDS